jgi:hypothetical protein
MSTEQDKARAVPNQPLSSAIGYAAAVLRAHADKLPLPSHAKALADRCQEASNLLANTVQGEGVREALYPAALAQPNQPPAGEDGDTARDVLADLSSYVGAGIGDESTTPEQYGERIRWGIDHLCSAASKKGSADA